MHLELVNWPDGNKLLLVKCLRVEVEVHSGETLYGDMNYYSLFYEL